MHEPSASAGRSTKRYNQQHRKASRVAGKMTLPQFLEGYERIKLRDACRAAPIRSGGLAVWVNSTGVWTQVDAQKLWGRRGNESLCRTLVMRLLGMSQAQYNSMKDAFEDDNAPELIGIYRNGANKYAIVVRLPTDNKVWRGGAMVGVGLAGLAVGALSSKVNIRGTPSAAVDLVAEGVPNPDKWRSAFQHFIKDVHILAALSRPTVKAEFKLSQFESNIDALERHMFLWDLTKEQTHAENMRILAIKISNDANELKQLLKQVELYCEQSDIGDPSVWYIPFGM